MDLLLVELNFGEILNPEEWDYCGRKRLVQ
jgi:hypothetical protein